MPDARRASARFGSAPLSSRNSARRTTVSVLRAASSPVSMRVLAPALAVSAARCPAAATSLRCLCLTLTECSGREKEKSNSVTFAASSRAHCFRHTSATSVHQLRECFECLWAGSWRSWRSDGRGCNIWTLLERELCNASRAVARFLLVGGGASWGNINLSIKICLQNFKIEKNCIGNFSKCFANSLINF